MNTRIPSSENSLVPVEAPTRESLSRILPAAAGRAVGWRTERRGSFLVLAVGVLALLAVITLVYAGIGLSDRQRAGAKTVNANINNKTGEEGLPGDIANYIAKVIADSTVNVTYDKFATPANAAPIFSRQAIDYPQTSWEVLSDATAAPGRRFLPTGAPWLDTNNRLRNGAPQQWGPANPWLASTLPTYLDFAGAGHSNPNAPYLDNRDWEQISNVAPNGLFVNLWNLRRNFFAEQGTTASATPRLNQMSANLSLLSAGPNPTVAGSVNAGQVTDFTVSLTNALRNQPAYFTMRQRGLFRSPNDISNAPGLNNPGDIRFLPYQYADTDGDGMYDARWCELRDDLQPGNPFNLIARDPKFRYFVAVRIIDLSSLINVNTATDSIASPIGVDGAGTIVTPIGSSPSEVDLRRILTMRDAYDLYRRGGGPITTSFGGYNGIPQPNPLTGFANYAGFDANEAAAAGGYAYRAIRLSLAGSVVPGRRAATAPFADYIGAGLTGTGLTGGQPSLAFDLNLLAAPAGVAPGRFSWDFNTDQPGGYTGAQARLSYYKEKALGRDGSTQASTAAIPALHNAVISAFGISDTAELLTHRMLNDSSIESTLERVTGGRGEYPANTLLADRDPLRSNRPLDVERQLLQFGNINNTFYQLSAVDVRQLLTTISFSRPLMAARGVSPDRLSPAEDRHNAAASPMGGVSDVKIDAIKIVSDLRKPDFGVQTTANFDRTLADLQGQYDKYLSVRTLFKGYADALLPFSDEQRAWRNNAASGYEPATRSLFYGYRGPELALYTAAHMALNFADMHGGPSNNGNLRPSAVTLRVDSTFDIDADFGTPAAARKYPWWHFLNTTQPNAGTTKVAGRQLDLDAIRNPAGAPVGAAPTSPRLANGGNTPTARAVNVFGVTPQPFLTAAATFTVYHDASDQKLCSKIESQNGNSPVNIGPTQTDFYIPTATSRADDDYDPSGVRAGDPVTVRPAISVSNFDFLFRVFAVQITNPFDTSITLGSHGGPVGNNFLPGVRDAVGAAPTSGIDASEFDLGDETAPPLDREDDFYYVRFGERIYKLCQLDDEPELVNTAITRPTPPEFFPSNETYSPGPGKSGIRARAIVLQPHETVWCYALSQPMGTIARRIAACRTAGTVTGTTAAWDLEVTNAHKSIENFIERRQLRGTGINRCIWMPEINPNDGYAGNLDDVIRPVGVAVPALPRYESWLTVNPATGAAANTDRKGLNAFGSLWVEDFIGTGGPNRILPADNQIVELWRTLRVGDEAVPKTVNALPSQGWSGAAMVVSGGNTPVMPDRNLYTNDLLVDRLRAPQDADMDARIRRIDNTAANDSFIKVNVPGTQGGTADDSPNATYDNRGITFALWASVRRPNDPKTGPGYAAVGTPGGIPLGAIPAYCMETKDPGNFSPTGTSPRLSWNVYEACPRGRGSVTSPTGAVWDMPGRAEVLTLGGDNVNNALRRSQFSELDVVADAPDRRANALWMSVNDYDVPPNVDDTASTNRSFWTRPAYDDMYPEFSFGRQRAANEPFVLRLTDMLRPLAIGPMHNPDDRLIDPDDRLARRAGPLYGPRTRESQWTTFGEMLAMTMGYETILLGGVSTLPASGLPDRPAQPTYALFQGGVPEHAGPDANLSATNYRIRPANTAPRPFDRGNLVLDDYVPFDNNDRSMSGSATPDPDYNAGDTPRGLRIPAALAILEQFNTLGDRDLGRAFGGLTDAVPGLVNINTAPQPAMRAVPMLAPIRGDDPTSEFLAAGTPLWWRDPARMTGVLANRAPLTPIAETTTVNPNLYDFTAGIAAYRSKTFAEMRPDDPLNLPPAALIAVPPAPQFYDVGVGVLPDSPANVLDGRSTNTGITAINEQPGLRSVGELLAVRSRLRAVGTTTAANANADRSLFNPYNIDALGHVFDPATTARQNSSFVGIDSVTYTDGGNQRPNSMKNEWSEQLQVASGALGSLTTRSDVFACWFIVHGYQQSDVENLGQNDPLVPTIARRFLMIVDRSNVTQKGDKPRILLFKELPLN